MTPTDAARGDLRDVVVFVPGLLASSAFFQVGPTPAESLTAWFERRGFTTVAWDPPGIGRSRDDDPGRPIDFRRRVDDLIATLAKATTARDRVFLVCHSLGGAQTYAMAALLGRSREPAQRTLLDRLAAVITIASPARLESRRAAPWERLFSPAALPIVQRLQRGGVIDAPSFLVAQGRISTRGSDRWLLPGLLPDGLARWLFARILDAAKRSEWVCKQILSGPELPSTVLRNAGDFTPEQFQRFLAADVLQRDSARLIEQLLGWGIAGGTILLDGDGEEIDVVRAYAELAPALPTLALSSTTDKLVTAAEVDAIRGPKVERASVGECGHGAYLLRRFDEVVARIEAFLAPRPGVAG